jgi:small conductance mechanosensitive channel
MENQFGVGDIVRIEDKAGVVENMTLRVVTLRDLQGVLHIIPNGNITSVSNLTRSWARVVVDVGVAYREDVDRVLGVMREVAEELWSDPEWHNRFVEQPLVLGVDQLADSGVVIRAWASTRPGKQFEVRREWLRRIKKRFDAEGIEIPFPHRTVYVRELPRDAT